MFHYIRIFKWKYVEQKTRAISLTRKTNFFIRVGGASIFLSILSLIAIKTNWLQSEKLQMEFYLSYKIKARQGVCFLYSGADDENLYNENECITTGKNNNVVLIGDSHAAH
jgi:hypothetical protein